MSLKEHLGKRGFKEKQRRTAPLWAGPEGEGPNGGISYSLLSRWLMCKERFRILAVEGLRTAPSFHPPIGYGSMWHICEENYKPDMTQKDWEVLSLALQKYCQGLCKEYPTQQTQIIHWYGLCKLQFPLYCQHWCTYDKADTVTAIFKEKPFGVYYTLPDSRKVRLRGRWDFIYERRGKIWCQDNKTKSQIDQVKLTRQLSFDLQTMLYLVALKEYQKSTKDCPWRDLPIAGVRYNVIRRSAHKSAQSMVEKIQEDQRTGRIGEWFSRWDTIISSQDAEVFRQQCLDPILMSLCNWWKMVRDSGSIVAAKQLGSRPYASYHWRHPFGVYNVLDEGGSSDLDYFLQTGSRVGLQETDVMFPEL